MIIVEMVRSDHVLYYIFKVESPGFVGKLKDLEGPQKRLRRNGQQGRRKPEESVVLSGK